jgi:predicted DNA-binding transcriptional regulator AlpA
MSKAKDNGRLLTPEEVAHKLQIAWITLAKWRSARTGPRFVRVGRYIRYRPEDIDEWVAQRTEKTRPL